MFKKAIQCYKLTMLELGYKWGRPTNRACWRDNLLGMKRICCCLCSQKDWIINHCCCGVLEGSGSSRTLAGIFSTYPGTSPTPWCQIVARSSGGGSVYGIKKLIQTINSYKTTCNKTYPKSRSRAKRCFSFCFVFRGPGVVHVVLVVAFYEVISAVAKPLRLLRRKPPREPPKPPQLQYHWEQNKRKTTFSSTADEALWKKTKTIMNATTTRLIKCTDKTCWNTYVLICFDLDLDL